MYHHYGRVSWSHFWIKIGLG
ncbi:hypothetical protein LINGRAHAP2_LOCUS18437 [Linum grandiflorum]